MVVNLLILLMHEQNITNKYKPSLLGQLVWVVNMMLYMNKIYNFMKCGTYVEHFGSHFIQFLLSLYILQISRKNIISQVLKASYVWFAC